MCGCCWSSSISPRRGKFCRWSRFPGNLAGGNNKSKHGAMVHRQQKLYRGAERAAADVWGNDAEREIILENIISCEIDTECIWIPSHCALPKNDAADELSGRGILESNLLIQEAVPLAMEPARFIIKPTVQTNSIRVPALPDELNISNRRAKAVRYPFLANESLLFLIFTIGPARIRLYFIILYVQRALTASRRLWKTGFCGALGALYWAYRI